MKTATDSSPEDIPLVVDLDGTLLRTDLTVESALRLIKQKPWRALAIPVWLLKGRAYLKRRICELIRMDVSVLPFREDLLGWLREEKARGRRLILATGSDYHQACAVVKPLRLFDVVLGSDRKQNLKGRMKLNTLMEICEGEFDYVGNSRSDIEIWRRCRYALLVNTSRRVERCARRSATVTRLFLKPAGGFADFCRAMRCYQWIKNLLLFVPMITSHTLFDPAIAGRAALAFVSFSFCASAVYLVNDLLDLEEDRQHSTKKLRPLASGRISVGAGMVLAAVCLAVGAILAPFVTYRFGIVLVAYLGITSLYSVVLKRLLVIDVVTLAVLYTLRLVAGSAATSIILSPWLLSFAFFLFLSLAFAKRASDLVQNRLGNEKVLPGRGYTTVDLDTVSIAGLCSGFLSALVLALYIDSQSVQLLYRDPALLWGLQPILLFYITRLWIICRRGELTEDPIQYTATELSTYGAAFLTVLVLLAAIFGLPFFF